METNKTQLIISPGGIEKPPKTEKEDPSGNANPAENLIKKNYLPRGLAHQSPEYISPMDLWDTLSAYITVSKDQITQAMETLGFNHQIIEGEPYWIVYPIPR